MMTCQCPHDNYYMYHNGLLAMSDSNIRRLTLRRQKNLVQVLMPRHQCLYRKCVIFVAQALETDMEETHENTYNNAHQRSISTGCKGMGLYLSCNEPQLISALKTSRSGHSAGFTTVLP